MDQQLWPVGHPCEAIRVSVGLEATTNVSSDPIEPPKTHRGSGSHCSVDMHLGPGASGGGKTHKRVVMVHRVRCKVTWERLNSQLGLLGVCYWYKEFENFDSQTHE